MSVGLQQPIQREHQPLLHQKSLQRISPSGRILVSRKAWAFRVAVVNVMSLVVCYNVYAGLALGDPLIVYSTLMPLHALTVFIVGWFFKVPARGKEGDDLVSVIIPVYNQESMIEPVIDAIFKSTYRRIEVIAVNDGSRDGTKDLLDRLAREYPGLKVIHKKNEGKRKAVAAGFYASKGKFVVLIDSDSVVDEKAIMEFMKAFAGNPRVGGIVGVAKVWNAEKNVLTRCQDVWYDYAFNIHKTCESFFGAVMCCSGCLSGYRREAIADFIPFWVRAKIHNSDDRDLTSYAVAPPWAKKELAPFAQNLMESMAEFDDAEDRSLTSQTLVEWKTVYVPTAIVYTEVPETVKGYLRQQVRWKKGFLGSNFFVSSFFWQKNPIMSILIFYTEFMATFTSPIIMFAVFVYEPLLLHQLWIPLIYVLGQLMIGLGAGLDYRLRDPRAKNWKYKPLMNVVSSFLLSWLIVPALLTYRKNAWLTR